MGRVIQFEERAVATLRERLGAAEIGARRPCSPSRAAIRARWRRSIARCIAALEADSFDALARTSSRSEWPAMLGLDCGRAGAGRRRAGVSHRRARGRAAASRRLIDRALAAGRRSRAAQGRARPSLVRPGRRADPRRSPGRASTPTRLIRAACCCSARRGDDADASDQGAQLLQFLGAALGAMLRRWATTS